MWLAVILCVDRQKHSFERPDNGYEKINSGTNIHSLLKTFFKIFNENQAEGIMQLKDDYIHRNKEMTLLKEYGYLIVRPFILTSDVNKKTKK